MSNEPLAAAVKTRVGKLLKRQLKEEARRRELKESDIAREAFREYFQRRDRKEGSAA